MKVFKRTIIAFFIILFALSIFNKAKASSNLYLNNLDFDVQINSDGSMDVVETWNIDISETNTLYKTFKFDSTKYSSITNGEVSSYWYGVAAFRSFEQAYHLLTEGTNKSSNYVFCNDFSYCIKFNGRCSFFCTFFHKIIYDFFD